MPNPQMAMFRRGDAMRTAAVPALAVMLLLPVPAVGAGVGCLSHPWGPWVANGVTSAEGGTRAGQPCQIGFGELGGIIEELRIVVRPSHGVLGVSGQEGNRRYVAYV